MPVERFLISREVMDEISQDLAPRLMKPEELVAHWAVEQFRLGRKLVALISPDQAHDGPRYAGYYCVDGPDTLLTMTDKLLPDDATLSSMARASAATGIPLEQIKAEWREEQLHAEIERLRALTEAHMEGGRWACIVELARLRALFQHIVENEPEGDVPPWIGKVARRGLMRGNGA